MKKIFFYSAILIIISSFLSGCGLDNYDSPKSVLTGNVVYDGQNVGVKGTGSTVQLELWQSGYELYTAIPVYVTQDGSFHAELFDGNYKLVSKSGSGPWTDNQDTINVVVSGNTVCEYPITPYYTISGESFKLNGTTLTATFNITQVSGSLSVERAILVVNKTSFVDETSQIARFDKLSPGVGQVTVTMDLSSSALSNTTLNARVGVKISGREAIYSTVSKIK